MILEARGGLGLRNDFSPNRIDHRDRSTRARPGRLFQQLELGELFSRRTDHFRGNYCRAEH